MGARLDGRCVVVTGGGRGLGAAFAAGIADEGASFCIADLDGERAAGAAAQVPGAIGVGADCAKTAGICAALDAVEREWGRPADGLVNNAGVMSSARLLDVGDDEIDRVLLINTAGPFRATREFARRLVAAGCGGSVVNVTSMAAHIASLSGLTAYAASKGGVRAFTHAAAVDLARFDIRVNALAPGWVRTDMTAELGTDDRGITARIPLRRPAEPSDLVGAVIYLLADESAYVTGTTIPVDGGWLAF